MFRVIEKAIIDSDLGIMPENNGEIIRIGIPPLTEERRKQLAKQCKAEGETAKVSIRNARRDGIDALKKAVKTVWLKMNKRTQKLNCRRFMTNTLPKLKKCWLKRTKKL